MAETFEKKVSSEIMGFIGGASNIVGHANSLVFFIEISVKDVNAVRLDCLHRVIGIRGASIKDSNVQIVLGPGKARQVTDTFNDLLAEERAKLSAAPRVVKRKTMKERGVFASFFQQLMASISYMIPFMLVGGLITAISFIVCVSSNIEPWVITDNILKNPDVAFAASVPASVLYLMGSGITTLVLPILAGFLAYSIAGRAGIISGFAGGFSAGVGQWSLLFVITRVVGNEDLYGIIANSTAGFLGAIVAGFLAGYSVLFLQKRLNKMPSSIAGIRDVLLIPILSTAFVLLCMFILNIPMSSINLGIYTGLDKLAHQGSLLIVSAGIVAMLMATDMGGPINKAAHMFAISYAAHGASELGIIILAANVVGLMIPPLGVSMAAWLFPQKFSKEERTSSIANAVCGVFGITEGAIPSLVRDPARVIISCMAGSLVGGVISASFSFNVISPEGGLISIFMSGAICYQGLIALVAGSFVTALLLGLTKPNVSADKAKLGKFKGIPIEKFTDLVCKPFKNITHKGGDKQ